MGALAVERNVPVEEGITERLLRAAGIRRGMQVLNLGCGEGDVSMLAASLVGPNGLILGVDHNPDALETARNRAWMADLGHVYFLDADADSLQNEGPFDAVIGRDILSGGPDAIFAVRRAASLLCAGGVLVLHESSPGVMRTLEDAGLQEPKMFGGTVAGEPQFCAWARKA